MSAQYNKYAILTTDILLNPSINSNLKILLATINSLANEKGYCFASNSYLATPFTYIDDAGNETTKTNSTISRYLTELEDKGLIKRTEVNGKRRIYVMDTQVVKVEEKQVEVKPEPEKTEKIDWDMFVDYWNKHSGNRPDIRKPISDKRKKKVKSLVNIYDKATVMSAIKKVGKSDYLQGKPFDFGGGATQWDACNFDWVFNRTNFDKIMEDKYDNSRNKMGKSKQVKTNDKFVQSNNTYGADV